MPLSDFLIKTWMNLNVCNGCLSPPVILLFFSFLFPFALIFYPRLFSYWQQSSHRITNHLKSGEWTKKELKAGRCGKPRTSEVHVADSRTSSMDEEADPLWLLLNWRWGRVCIFITSLFFFLHIAPVFLTPCQSE